MCTIGYHKKLNVVFKNRDKNRPTEEVIVVKSDILAVKTEGSDYYSLGVNKYGVAFVSAAINTPKWTSFALKGMNKEARAQFEKENKGLVNPMITVSKLLKGAKTARELIGSLLDSGGNFMGYNLIVADGTEAARVELHRKSSHVRWHTQDVVATNHFQHLDHGPKAKKDYPSSFKRLELACAMVKDAISMEDIFSMLKVQHVHPDEGLWRTGTFPTVSSSVIDREALALFYTADHGTGYSRTAFTIPPKGGEKVFIEMSRYIDLPTYHAIERGHPFYTEMIDEIKSQIERYHGDVSASSKGPVSINALELGAGTGLCSLELLKYPFIKLDALDIDSECCKILASHPEAASCNVIIGDAAEYCRKHHYDLVVSTFAHDHVHYNKRFAFAKNIFNNLKKGGIYVMGGEILPYFSNDHERKRSLFRYHNTIIDIALQHGRVQLSELENNALKSGLDMVGDFKRHEAMFEDEMKSAGFKLLEKKMMGPLDRKDVGGVFVYVYQAV